MDGVILLGPTGADCDVPAGTPVAVSPAFWECSTAEGHGETFVQLRRTCEDHFRHTFGIRRRTIRIRIDRVLIPAPRRWTFQTPGEIVDFPDPNLWGLPPGPTKSVTEGFVYVLRGLTPGNHLIRVKMHIRRAVGWDLEEWKLHVA